MTFNKYVMGLALGAGLAVAAVAPVSAAGPITDHKIGICHATGSKTNPYVFIVVDKHAAAAHAKHQDGRDVIGVSSADKCPKPVSAAATPAATPTPTPGKGELLSTSTTAEPARTTLPDTGGELGALVGVPAMLLAGRAYLRSRTK